MRIFLLTVSVLFALSTCGQTKRVLFLGNSYTNSNNLPNLVRNLALSVEDTLEVGFNTPGGFRLMQHASNATSQNLIAQGAWDFVVLQEQSQLPSFPDSQVDEETFPYAQQLNEQVLESNPCAETVFYRTWGRENGDAQNCEFWPPVCTYEGMDSLLHLRYMQMAEENDAVVSPVGEVWKYLRENNPEINLYTGDGSHPSAAGSYAAACSFYTVFFRKDPSLLTFDFSLGEDMAETIRQASKVVVFDQLEDWFVGTYDLTNDWTWEPINGLDVQFSSLATNYTSVLWAIEGEMFTNEDFTHTFQTEGDHDIVFTAISNCDTITTTQTISIQALGTDQLVIEPLNFYPNPSSGILNLDIEASPKSYLEVYNMDGTLVWKGALTKNQFDLSGLALGIYTIKIQDGNQIRVGRVVLFRE